MTSDNSKEQHIYIIKRKQKVELSGAPFEYEELLGKCTSDDEAARILARHPDAYISETSVYSHGDLFRYE